MFDWAGYSSELRLSQKAFYGSVSRMIALYARAYSVESAPRWLVLDTRLDFTTDQGDADEGHLTRECVSRLSAYKEYLD